MESQLLETTKLKCSNKCEKYKFIFLDHNDSIKSNVPFTLKQKSKNIFIIKFKIFFFCLLLIYRRGDKSF